MPSISTFVDEELARKINEYVAKTGAPSKSDFIKKILEREIERLEGKEQEFEEEAEAQPKKRKGRKVVVVEPTDPLDDYLYTLKKVAVAKLFQQLALSPTVTPEVALHQGQQLQQLLNPNATPPKSEDIELKDIMKYNALMLQMMNQAEAFRKMGKTEEASKLEDRIMQMMQMQQNMMQTYLQGQQNLFQTALSVKKETEQEYKEQLGGLGQKLEEIKDQLWQQRLEFEQKEREKLAEELEKIKNQPPKSDLDKFIEIYEKSKENPILKKAIETALGVKSEEMTLDKVLKAVSKLGIDKLIDSLAGYLKKSSPSKITEIPKPESSPKITEQQLKQLESAKIPELPKESTETKIEEISTTSPPPEETSTTGITFNVTEGPIESGTPKETPKPKSSRPKRTKTKAKSSNK